METNLIILILRCYGSKTKWGWFSLLIFLVNIIFSACLIKSGLKLIFYWHITYLLIFTKSLINSSVEMFTLWTIKNKEASTEISLAFDKSSARWFMYIRDRSRLIVKPWATHTLTTAKGGPFLLSAYSLLPTSQKIKWVENVIRYAILF